MRKILLALIPAFFFLSCGAEDDPTPTPTPTPDPPATEKVFARGADVSWLSEMEHDGVKFKKADGSEADLLAILKDCGMDAIRLRVWVKPYSGWSSKNDVVGLAKRAKAAGMDVMIDFHYSDFFADPGRQVMPAEWDADKNDVTKIATHVKEHTTEVLQALKNAGVSPKWIQVGNETRSGMLYPAGRITGSNTAGFSNFATLYNAGYDAAKAVFPSVIVMPHLNNALDNNVWWFENLKNAGAKFDAIGLSHYPQADDKISAAQCNFKAVEGVKTLYSTFKVPVFIVEVGVKPAKSDAASVLKSFMDSVKDLEGCAGVLYWEPEVYGGWVPAVYKDVEALSRLTGTTITKPWGSYDQGAFTSDGRPHSILDAFKK